MEHCAICIDDIETPFHLLQCNHYFHSVCIMKYFEQYLIDYGTEYETVKCPICNKRISYHCILEKFIEKSNLEDVIQVINKNNINTKCHLDRSLLIVASTAGKIDTVKYLIQQGLPIDEPNNLGLTPFYYAATYGHLDIVKYLVENFNININCESFFGCTPLDQALKNKHYSTVEYLKNINAKNGIEKHKEWFNDYETIINVMEMLI